MSFKIKDSLAIGAVTVFNGSGQLTTPKVKDAGSAFTVAITPTTLTADRIVTLPDKAGTVAMLDDIGGSANAGTLSAATSTTGATNTGIEVTFSAAWDANSAANVTIKNTVGPAISALVTTMTGVGTGFLRKNGADTYSLDTATYLTAESDTLATVTGRGATTSVALSITNATASTTTGTGALVISGGLGVAGAIWAGSVQGTPVGSTTASTGAFTTLGASGTVTLSPLNAAVTLSPTGTGVVTVNPATAGTINNMSIGATTRGSGAFTTLDANAAVGLSPANAAVTLSPTGTGVVTINPAAAGTINNMSIGATTRGSGAFTTLAANAAVTLTAGTSSTTTGTGTVVVTGGVGISENLNIGGSAVISGNLTVNGTTYTVNSTVTTLADPILTLGGDTAPVADDNKDRGIEFRWHNGSLAKTGFFGLDDSTGYFTFIPDGTNTAEVYAGTLGDFQATNFRGALVGNADTATTATKSTNLVGGNSTTLLGSMPYQSNTDTTILLAPNTTTTKKFLRQTGTGTDGAAPAWDTLVNADVPSALTGKTYNALSLTALATGFTVSGGTTAVAASFIGGAAYSISGTNATTITLPSTTGTVALNNQTHFIGTTSVAINRTSAALSLTGIPSIDGVAADTATLWSAVTTGSITVGAGLTTGTLNLAAAGTGATNINVGHTNATTIITGAVKLPTVGTSGFVKLGAAGVLSADTNTYVVTGADTLQTVTTNGATTSTALTFTNTTDSTSLATGAIKISGGLAVTKSIALGGELIETTAGGVKIAASQVVQTAVATVALTAVDTWAIATYRSAKYVVQITQGTNYQVSEIMVIHNGTTTTMTEFAVLETNGALATFTSDVSTGNARLLVTMGAATASTINVQRTLIVI
jgi:hypothetical protein